ncbi:MAG: NifU family protein [Candidatus Margulisbacteria bacterium]|jgi:Fe-S cluster biogenesis protein NfuA|nr:NifU family protein [Candidatus Margulisiibacteriota bacterium]
MSKKHVQLSASPTPNPNAVKFLPNMHFFESGTVEFQKSSDHMDESPMAKKLFEIDGIDIVMIGFNFISVTKSQAAQWESLLEPIRDCIVSHLENDELVINLEFVDAIKRKKNESSSDIEVKIRQILDDEIRPAIAMDGGDVELRSFENGIVTLHLQGACSTCPSSTMTLKMGIENRLKSEIPEVVEVVQEI